MKNWLYIPFLVLMSITYTRVVENMKADNMNRLPASVEIELEEECLNFASQLNPHFMSDQCL